MPKVTSSQDAYDYLISVWSPQVERIEEFLILCLNRANKVLGYAKISQGGLSGTVADPKVIFQVALKANASSVILCHNHPSGNTKPSDNDIQLTKKLKKAGEFLELNVLDHLIITTDSYFSFADESLL
jgi:DNA repair protein RadC